MCVCVCVCVCVCSVLSAERAEVEREGIYCVSTETGWGPDVVLKTNLGVRKHTHTHTHSPQTTRGSARTHTCAHAHSQTTCGHTVTFTHTTARTHTHIPHTHLAVPKLSLETRGTSQTGTNFYTRLDARKRGKCWEATKHGTVRHLR